MTNTRKTKVAKKRSATPSEKYRRLPRTLLCRTMARAEYELVLRREGSETDHYVYAAKTEPDFYPIVRIRKDYVE